MSDLLAALQQSVNPPGAEAPGPTETLAVNQPPPQIMKILESPPSGMGEQGMNDFRNQIRAQYPGCVLPGDGVSAPDVVQPQPTPMAIPIVAPATPAAAPATPAAAPATPAAAPAAAPVRTPPKKDAAGAKLTKADKLKVICSCIQAGVGPDGWASVLGLVSKAV